MIIKFFKGANKDSRYIRTEVFIKEQNFKVEFDEYDNYVTTLVIYNDNMSPIATGRFYNLDNDPCVFKLGRIAILKEYRKCGLGRIVIKELEKEAVKQGAKKFFISAQIVAQGFYEKCGYVASDELYYEEHVKHVAMYKDIL